MTPASGQPTIWLVDGLTMLLYIAIGVLVYALSAVNDRIYWAPSKEKPFPPAAILAITSVSVVLAVASLVLMGNALSRATRLSMLALPLLVLVERYARIMIRRPKRRSASASALAGSVAGLAIGAWAFMRKTAASDPVARVTIPGDVRTIPVPEVLRDKGTWTISLMLVVFYVISCAIFFGLHALIKPMAKKMTTCPPDKRTQRTALAGIAAFALNFLGVVALLLLARRFDVQLRLAMVGFPMLLIAESYAKLLRAEPHNRPVNWPGLIGSGGGMAVATFFLLRGAPLH